MDGSINDEFNLDFDEVYNVGGGTSDFNQLTNRPKYNNQEMTGNTNIPEVKNYTSGTGISIEDDEISVDTDVIATKSDIPVVPDVVQTTGQDTGDVMSQKATTDAISSEATARTNADLGLQGQIDALAASSDVTDIVGTKSDLNSYDTSKLKDNDIIKVLQDESQNDETTYYRWSISTHSFTLIGEEGPYYTKSAADQKFQKKLVAGSNISIGADGETISATDTTYSAFTGTDGQTAGTAGLVPAPAITDGSKFLKGDGSWGTPTDTTYTAGTNVQISSGNVISATDTTYSNFVGTNGQTAGIAGLVPAPATTDAGKFLKADGTWDTAGGGGDTVYSTVTTSNSATGGAVYIGNLDANQAEQVDPTTTDNHYKYFWALPYDNSKRPTNGSINILGNSDNYSFSTIVLGNESVVTGNGAFAIGWGANSTSNSIALGRAASAGLRDSNINNSVAIGTNTRAGASYSIAIGGCTGNSYSIPSNGSEASVTIGKNSMVGTYSSPAKNAVALGAYSYATRQGELNVGLPNDYSSEGFNSTKYRLISGVYDGQDVHDAATVAQGNTLAATAPTTSTVGVLGQLYTDTTNMHTYQCTAIDDVTDPSNPSYTWTQRW